MTEMIEAEPALAERLLEVRPVAIVGGTGDFLGNGTTSLAVQNLSTQQISILGITGHYITSSTPLTIRVVQSAVIGTQWGVVIENTDPAVDAPYTAQLLCVAAN